MGHPVGAFLEDEARVIIRAGDVEIDLSGAQSSVDERLVRIHDDDTWSIALSRIRNAREKAISAAVEAAKAAGLPERGSAFKSLIDNCNSKETRSSSWSNSLLERC